MSDAEKESDVQAPPVHPAGEEQRAVGGSADIEPQASELRKEPTNDDAGNHETSNDDEKKDSRIKKRPLETAASKGSAFSLRRGGAQQSNAPKPSPGPMTTSTFQQKPPWMSDDDFAKLQTKTSSPSPSLYGSDSERPKKLRAPSRRGHDSYTPPQAASDEAQHREAPVNERDEIVTRDIAYKKQDLNISIRQHYNERAWDSKKERRSESSIIKLRNFNNVIKHILIHESVRGPGARVLDLGCGKGGDLRKWEQVNPSQYVGIDISNASIVEAARRYRSNRSRFPVVFATGDAFGLPLPEILIDFPEVQFPMDIVSMQFCLHYAFETEVKARQTIENVARSLRPGGVFIGTIPNSDHIGHMIRHMKQGSKSFGNELYSVTFEKQPPKNGDFEQPFGNVYNYFLKDAIDNVPEYIIPFETLRAICSDYGLRLQSKEPFQDYFFKQIPKWYERLSPRALEGIRKENGKVGVSGQESEATSYFYLTFTFVKAG